MKQPTHDGLAVAKSLYCFDGGNETDSNLINQSEKHKDQQFEGDVVALRNFISLPVDSSSSFTAYERAKAKLRLDNLDPDTYENELKKVARRLRI